MHSISKVLFTGIPAVCAIHSTPKRPDGSRRGQSRQRSGRHLAISTSKAIQDVPKQSSKQPRTDMERLLAKHKKEQEKIAIKDARFKKQQEERTKKILVAEARKEEAAFWANYSKEDAMLPILNEEYAVDELPMKGGGKLKPIPEEDKSELRRQSSAEEEKILSFLEKMRKGKHANHRMDNVVEEKVNNMAEYFSAQPNAGTTSFLPYVTDKENTSQGLRMQRGPANTLF